MPWEGYWMLSRMPCKKVFFQAGLKGILALTLFFMCVPGMAGALELIVSPTGSNNDQTIINQALEDVKNAGGGKVYLNAGTYEVNNAVIIWSNTILTGSNDAVIMVSSSSSKWFTGRTGVICNNELVNNVEIYGFQINGNIQNLPESYSHTRPDTAHDTENLIRLQGDSNNFMTNIKVHDMKSYDSFGDGCHIIYCNHAHIYNNFISNCQHEGVFWYVVTESEMYNNQIAGITSDCTRLDNCVNCKVYDNVLFSYDGDSSGEYKHGENGLQVGDGGASHGYDARNAPTTTTNIEITNNTFANNGLKSILLGSHSDNSVYIHDNKFIGVSELETLGISVKGISPTIQQSKKVFTNIFDILKMDYDFVYPDLQQDLNGNVQVLSYENYSLLSVQGEGLTAVKIRYGASQVTHYLNKDIWIGSLQHQGSRVYLPGSFQKEDLKVTCISSAGYQVVTNFEIIEKREQPGSINPDVIPFTGTLIIFGIALFRNLGRLIK
jgi:hypothetical protein